MCSFTPAGCALHPPSTLARDRRLLVAEVRNVHMCFQFASASNLCCALEDLYRKVSAVLVCRRRRAPLHL